MTKLLCVTAFTALFFNASCAAEKLFDYSVLPRDHQEYCEEFKTKKCQEFVILIDGFITRNIPHLTSEEKQQFNELYKILFQERREKEGDIVTIKDNTQKETEPVINQTT